MHDLLSTLSALEAELHHSGTRCSAERLRALLHPAFHEVGRSGRAYARDTCIRFLVAEAVPLSVVSTAYAVDSLTPDVALLTYRSAHRGLDGTLHTHTLRSSVWQLTAVGWQLRYHQGTPAAEPWS